MDNKKNLPLGNFKLLFHFSYLVNKYFKTCTATIHLPECLKLKRLTISRVDEDIGQRNTQTLLVEM